MVRRVRRDESSSIPWTDACLRSVGLPCHEAGQGSVFLPESQQTDVWGVITMAEFDCSSGNTTAEKVLCTVGSECSTVPAWARTGRDTP